MRLKYINRYLLQKVLKTVEEKLSEMVVKSPDAPWLTTSLQLMHLASLLKLADVTVLQVLTAAEEKFENINAPSNSS